VRYSYTEYVPTAAENVMCIVYCVIRHSIARDLAASAAVLIYS